MVFSRLKRPTCVWGTRGFVWAVAFREREGVKGNQPLMWYK
jgi:hypothetical protein